MGKLRRRNNVDPPRKFGHDYSKDYNDPKWPFAKGTMSKDAWFLIIIVPCTIAGLLGYFYYQEQIRERVRRPLALPKVIGENASSASEDPERFWGTYRSSLYFGLKTRSPNSPLAGVMWFSQFTGEQPPPIRHWCDQNDGLRTYSWIAHDGRRFGIQKIVDKYVALTTDFVKRSGGSHGGEWTARVIVEPLKGAEQAATSVIFYMALDQVGFLHAETDNGILRHIAGRSPQLGEFKLRFVDRGNGVKRLNYLSTTAEGLHGLKETMMKGARLYKWDDSNPNSLYIGLGGHVTDSAENLVAFQITAQGPYELEAIFESGSVTSRGRALSGQFYQDQLTQLLREFDEKFEKVFEVGKKGANADEASVAKTAMSNMLGGIGYFYGYSIVRSRFTKQDEMLPYWNAPLYTAVPSRSFFPRGFLWDEGFHNLLIGRWDPDLSRDIIGHWMDLMNVDGWIPREQILGNEARAKVPEQFVVQYNENANPPTFFLPLQMLMKQWSGSDDAKVKTFLKTLFPRLKVWFDWFNTTQAGDLRGTYRWRGRTDTDPRQLNPLTLTSGLDDYPRASHPSLEERHVDLRCWMTLAAKVMADIARTINEPHQDYEATYDWLSNPTWLDWLHWNPKTRRYADWGYHTDDVRLARPRPPPQQPGQRPPAQRPMERVVDSPPKWRYVDSFGYVSLFPFLLRLLKPDSPKLGQILKDLGDEQLLWTKFGLRSLARTSPFYNKHNTQDDPPYWRSAIWINMNYLAVSALYHYRDVDGPYKERAAALYADLRTNIVRNMVQQYKVTGYIWEQYDDRTGKGKGSHPFTGWSALLVNIISEKF